MRNKTCMIYNVRTLNEQAKETFLDLKIHLHKPAGHFITFGFCHQARPTLKNQKS